MRRAKYIFNKNPIKELYFTEFTDEMELFEFSKKNKKIDFFVIMNDDNSNLESLINNFKIWGYNIEGGGRSFSNYLIVNFKLKNVIETNDDVEWFNNTFLSVFHEIYLINRKKLLKYFNCLTTYERKREMDLKRGYTY